jgi:Sulfotransferase family
MTSEASTAPSTTLDLTALMAAAQQAAGLEDFGDLEFVQWGQRWLDCAEQEGNLTDAGRAGLQQLITGWLVNRLRLTEDIKNHPEILDEVIREPIVVTGMPRTGTTKVQKVIAADPGLQNLPFWWVLNIAPMPGAEPGQPDPRIALAAGYIELLKQANPDFLIGHPAFVDEPEEELFVIEQDFRSMGNISRVRVPSYFNEIVDRPDFESYPFLKLCLQYAQWQRGEEGRRPWVIKTPSHLGNLDKVLNTFPDATIVHTYRDPAVTLGSIGRIMELFRSLAEDDFDLHDHGRYHLDAWLRMCQRHLQLREDPEIDARVVDVRYDDLKDDVISAVRRVYHRAGRELDAVTEQRMRAWEDGHPQYQLGRFEYTLERYGFTAEGLRSAFADYISRFERVPSR